MAVSACRRTSLRECIKTDGFEGKAAIDRIL